MKVSCLQENLAKGLAVVGRAVATRSTLPVLANVLLSTDASRLKLSATNLEVGINCWIGAKVDQEGAITVPARVLADLVNSLPSERIDMNLIARTHTLNLKCGRFEANVKGIDAQEFPLILVPEEDHRVEIPAEHLREMIDQVVFAAATDESRPVLTGVLVEVGPDGLSFAAADGYRLSLRSMPLDNPPEEAISAIVPARALQELRRISTDVGESVEMLIAPSRNQIFFHLADIDLVSQLVEGQFPDLRHTIPTSHKTTVTASTPDVLQAVRTAHIFARDSANVVRLQVVPGAEGDVDRLIVTATSAEHGDNVSELDVTLEGEPLEIAFNARYLIDALSVVDAAQFSLAMRDASSPGVVRPVGGADFVHVFMPMYTTR